mgnify:CR=1 FL=1
MKRYLSYTILILFFVSLSSCKKSYLDTAPSDQADIAKIFENINNVKVALNGIYRGTYRQYSDQEQDGHPAIMICMDYMGEDVVHTSRGTEYFRGTYQLSDHYNELNNLPYFAYRMYYAVIANANLILDRIDTVPDATDKQKDPIKGECLALRAWAHHMLVQLFGSRYVFDGTVRNNTQLGVPIMTTYSTAPQPRATVEQVYTQINTDLDKAIVLLSNLPSRGLNKTHLDKSVALGLKARVALTQLNWDDAAYYALEALKGYSLMSNAQVLDGFSDMKNSEWMWAANQLPEQLPAYGSFYAYMSANFNSAHTRPNPKKINSYLYGRIANTDIRKKLWCNDVNDYINYPGVINASTRESEPSQVRTLLMHKKFVVVDPAVSAGDIPYMRVAEMYLIAAEAKARGNRLTEAAEIMKTLGENRDPNYETPDDLNTLLANILIQRRIELWGEGFRFLDLKRTNVTMSRVSPATGADLSLINFQSLGSTSGRWQFKIPRRELLANPYITDKEQNP